VGCGCGDTTLEAASRVGSSGHVTGVDVSAPMLELARTRASGLHNVAFVEADAQTTDIASLGVDRIVSRFGVMFFADAADAFVNLRSAMAPDGSIAFVCWQTVQRNPWMGFGMRSVGGLLDFPQPEPGGPGPFSLGEEDALLDLMHTAGFASVELTALDGEIDIVGGATIEQAVLQSIDMSPIEALVGDDENLMATVRSTMTDAFAAEWSNGAILLPSSVWVVTASNA
jgi:SAM-dependent methyltransferase